MSAPIVNPHASTVQGLGTHDFYQDVTTTDSWQEIKFIDADSLHFVAWGQLFINDGANPVSLSYDGGTTTHGVVNPNEALEFQMRRNNTVHIKSTNTGNHSTVRVFAW